MDRFSKVEQAWEEMSEEDREKLRKKFPAVEDQELPSSTAGDVYSVFRTIIAQQLPRTRAFELAHAYARVGLELSIEHLRTHVLYLLANLQEWRGVEAEECKRILGNFISKA